VTVPTVAGSDHEATIRVLLVEDDSGLQRQMKWALTPCAVTVAGSRPEALQLFESDGPFEIVILDLGLPPDEDGASEGFKALGEILAHAPYTKVIVASGHADHMSAVNAVGKGAFDYFGKPVDIDELKLIIARAHRMHALERENRQLREAAQTLSGLVFASPKMGKVERMIERVGPTNVSILISGETGTGKEVVARALHERSPRKLARFVAINCASIPENLLESELFGHEKGAFTGAIKQTPGKVETAHNGTLFLDEIGDMPLALQAKLLRFLQDRQIERVGGRTPINVDVRLVCATNRDLQDLVGNGKFREDLYYRINEIRIDLPPLRERDNDAQLLAQHFLNVLNRSRARPLRGFSEQALAAIAAYSWPGNVRELENRMKRAIVMAEGKVISPSDLDLQSPAVDQVSLDLRSEVQKLEASLVQRALTASNGNISKAAKLLGISRPHLYGLMKGEMAEQ
jgi:two-component system, NtrC family, response regulator